MTLRGIAGGDIVRVDKKGRRFFAMATGPAVGGELPIKPLERRDSWRACTGREVIGIWRANSDTRLTALEILR